MTNRLAVYDLNKYLWEVAFVEYRAEFANVPLPFFPTQQVPEGLSGAHVVYTTRTIPGLDLWQTSTDEILYRVYASDIDRATVLSNELTRALRKLDDSAQAVNEYLAAQVPAGEPFKPDFHFLYTRVLGNNSPNPIDSEEGYWGRPVWVRSFYIENEY